MGYTYGLWQKEKGEISGEVVGSPQEDQPGRSLTSSRASEERCGVFAGEKQSQFHEWVAMKTKGCQWDYLENTH